MYKDKQRQTGVYKLQEEKTTLKVSVYFRFGGLDIHCETDEDIWSVNGLYIEVRHRAKSCSRIEKC